MQIPGTEAIRTQIQPSKLKREITKIKHGQHTKHIWKVIKIKKTTHEALQLLQSILRKTKDIKIRLILLHLRKSFPTKIFLYLIEISICNSAICKINF